ncbi:transketolase [Desertibaculum subflavum]|uniref:transketolase n=1 Tax=Desertibaculum subflavum TaxID=2268458 RepID=UPI000E667461
MPDSAVKTQVAHRDMANAIAALAMDAVQKANSGHPGMPMGMADVATVLFTRFLKFDPADPAWPDRDRFVLSAGHGSMLLYALLHLTGYPGWDIGVLKNFRQLGSPAAGHPEFGHGAGIETTTGPLGQGLGNAVGMAIAERVLNARFGDALVDHRTYAIAGDGCLMEGISHEAIGLAGHLRLSKLIVLFDDNGISIDGPTSLSTSEDQIGRFKAAGWATWAVDGHDPEAVAQAIAAAQKSDRPNLIACKTVIGRGAPKKQGTAATHGSPLGADEVAGARTTLGWNAAPFEIPAAIAEAWATAGRRGAPARADWTRRLAASEAREAFNAAMSGTLPAGLDTAIEAYKAKLATDKPAWATRKSSQMALEVINPALPETLGGSADLTGSNNTKTGSFKPITAADFTGRYIHYGIREHGMAAAMNGMALHGGVIPYGGTFLVFTDYCRPSIRLSALMGQRVVYVMTHDSIGLGEDGPTHQPVEHLAALRAIPNLNVYRPADAVETAECWQLALQSAKTPSILALTRQDLPAVRLTHAAENLCARGAYELKPAEGKARVTLLATGSEIAIALAARDLLQKDGIGTRVVSVPCFELFDAQSEDYQLKTLGADTVRIAVEAGVAQGWERYLRKKDGFVGMTGFGASAPHQDLYRHFGITPEAVAATAKARLG